VTSRLETGKPLTFVYSAVFTVPRLQCSVYSAVFTVQCLQRQNRQIFDKMSKSITFLHTRRVSCYNSIKHNISNIASIWQGSYSGNICQIWDQPTRPAFVFSILWILLFFFIGTWTFKGTMSRDGFF
jgi:hypothetical protein